MKYTLRFRRKGEELEPQTKVVRRHRRSEEKELAPTARQLFDRQARRQARQVAREELAKERQAFNSGPAASGYDADEEQDLGPVPIDAEPSIYTTQ